MTNLEGSKVRQGSRLRVAAALAAAVTLAAPAAASATTPAASCGPDASLLGFSDALDKTTYAGTDVGGLSALARLGGDRALALADNQGTTPARAYRLRLDDRRGPKVTGIVPLRRADGTPYTGADLDGEGLVALADGTFLVSSETEPSIRRFSRDGRQLAELPVPERFRVAPAGEAARNQTLEALDASADGRDLWAGMEGALSADGTTADGGSRVRFLHLRAAGRKGWQPAGQVGYVTDPGMNVTELQVVSDDQLLVLERGFTAGVGNTIRVYQAYLAGADDVTNEATLARDGLKLVAKRLVADLGACPPSGATNPGAQPNPLLDNVEALSLDERRWDGTRELTLLSDDNFSATQVTRLYRLRIALRDEPRLVARATYDATRLQEGPTSGSTGVGANNGQVPPFAGQPVPGFSGALTDPRGDGFWGMPDNGFGSQGNSRDFLLRMYHVRPQWKVAFGGRGELVLDRFLSLRDPDRKIPFPIVNETTKDRLLTGGDFDIEAVQRGARGDLWFGEEFGPYLLHTDATGKVLEAPVALPGVKAPQSHELADGEQPNLPGSRGFEAVAASKDGRTLYPILEAALTTDEDKTLRRVYEFDAVASRYTGRSWAFHADSGNHQIGDAQVLEDGRILFIERDDLEGPAAKVKLLATIDLRATPAADGTLPKRVVLDLLRIRDPFGVSGTGAFGLGDPFSFPLQSVETVLPLGGDRVLVANDNNYPDSNGRVPGKPDDVEAIVLDVPGLR